MSGGRHKARRRLLSAIPLVVSAIAGTLLLNVVPPLVAQAQQTDQTDVPGALHIDKQSSMTVAVPVPRGVTPTAVRGRLRVGRDAKGGRLEFRIGDRVSRDIEAHSAAPFDVPVQRGDLLGSPGGERTLEVTMTYTPTRACPLGSGPADIGFGHLRLRYRGTPAVPTSVADFFPAISSRIDVVIPRSADDHQIEAGLTAVAALSATYGADTTVELSPGDRVLPRAGLTQRVVRFAPGKKTAETSVGVRWGLPTLLIAGGGGELTRAARALGSDSLPLATQGSTGVSEQLMSREPSQEHTLADLGLPMLTISGPAEASASLRVLQDSFGGSLDSLRVQVSAVHSALPAESTSRLDTYVNGFLVDSQLLGEDLAVSVDATVPSTWLRADNDVTFTLDTVGAHTGCDDPMARPVELYVDGKASTVSAAMGRGMGTGFASYPQVLGGMLPVALRAGGPDRVRAAIDAAYLVSALQHSAGSPLAISLVDPDDFVDGTGDGLLVGALASDAVALDAPVRLDGRRVVDSARARFSVDTDQPFAALQAISTMGREVLLLGGWSPAADDGGLPAARRTAATYVARHGWPTASEDVLITGGSTRPFTLDSGLQVATVPPVVEDRSGVPWLLLAFLVLGLVLGVLVVLTVRRDRDQRSLGGGRRGAAGR